MQRPTLIALFCGVLLVVGVAIVVLMQKSTGFLPFSNTTVVEERLMLPDTESVHGADGRVITEGQYDAPLDPSRGELVSAHTALTIKGAYEKAVGEAVAWAPDARLVFIKSRGVLTAEGASGQWQVVFGSRERRTAYEVIVFDGAVAARKEVPATVYGFALPERWYDSGDALVSIRSLPQFAEATVSSLNFYYNTDSMQWGYAFSTSVGAVSMPVQ
jgi:hypothetical protein